MSMCKLVYLFNKTVVVSFRYWIECLIKLLDAKSTDMVQFPTFYEITMLNIFSYINLCVFIPLAIINNYI